LLRSDFRAKMKSRYRFRMGRVCRVGIRFVISIGIRELKCKCQRLGRYERHLDRHGMLRESQELMLINWILSQFFFGIMSSYLLRLSLDIYGKARARR